MQNDSLNKQYNFCFNMIEIINVMQTTTFIEKDYIF